MRIWHEDLIPLLCRQHLLACWREGLGIWSILINNKKGYRNHPAVKEWEGHLSLLFHRLELIRNEMSARGYHPKPLPMKYYYDWNERKNPKFYWQTLEEQTKVLKGKNCDCRI